ncbi:hypothetical protein [Pseudomonas monsensis]|uniref:hypothetical protein n=1 Tax=Pseudomonas monsensis TaxID=2745509 RepID=UPI003D1AACFF
MNDKIIDYGSLDAEQRLALCRGEQPAPSAFRALLAERNSLAFLLKRFVDGEHDQGENQSERHMYHDEAEALLAYLGGEVQGHTLVPDEILRAEHERKKALEAENERLTAACAKAETIINTESRAAAIATGRANLLEAKNERLRNSLVDVFSHIECNTECLVRDLVNWGTPKINPNDFYTECEAIKAIASTALNADVATPRTDTEKFSLHQPGDSDEHKKQAETGT